MEGLLAPPHKSNEQNLGQRRLVDVWKLVGLKNDNKFTEVNVIVQIVNEMGFKMEKAFEEQDTQSYQAETSTPPIMIWVHSVTEKAKNFFTMTEEEKEAAGISDYKNYRQ